MNINDSEISIKELDEITVEMSYYTEILKLVSDNGQEYVSAPLLNFFILRIDNLISEIRKVF